MKVHKDLKELLEDFSEDVIFWICNKGTQNIKTTVENYLSSNSLASVEPEPLAKNKQTENGFKCDACPETFDTLHDLVEHIKICEVDRYI